MDDRDGQGYENCQGPAKDAAGLIGAGASVMTTVLVAHKISVWDRPAITRDLAQTGPPAQLIDADRCMI
jgi:hypothetical protein